MSQNPESPRERGLINEMALRRYHEDVIDYLKEHGDEEFQSLRSSEFMLDHEDKYKKAVYWIAGERLGFHKWKKEDVGKGLILDAVINAVEQKGNNFVIHDMRKGEEGKEHRSLCIARKNPVLLKDLEALFYRFYKGKSISDGDAFTEFCKFKMRYALIGYLFFIKNNKKYLPIRPRNFNTIFKSLQFPFPPKQKCSWENYRHFLEVLKAVQAFLNDELHERVSLLETHSFLYLLIYEDFGQKVPPSDTSEIPFSELELDIMPERPEGGAKSSSKGSGVGSSEGSEKENKRTGDMAETVVRKREKQWLKKNGKSDLADKVSDVADKCWGYDVLSFELDGSEKHIEVKGSKAKCRQFHLTENELNVSLELENFYLYLVSDVFKKPEIQFVKNPKFQDSRLFGMDPTRYRVTYTPKK